MRIVWYAVLVTAMLWLGGCSGWEPKTARLGPTVTVEAPYPVIQIRDGQGAVTAEVIDNGVILRK
jgi:hypothetical protein